jgi:anti-anti-sigma regulatory factor
MFVIEADTTSKLLVLSIAGIVTADESKETLARVREKLDEMAPDFVALIDFRWLESMSPAGAPFVAQIMDAFTAKGVSAVVRVMPDPHKDIGLNILSPFHYGSDVRLMTFQTLADAIQALARD